MLRRISSLSTVYTKIVSPLLFPVWMVLFFYLLPVGGVAETAVMGVFFAAIAGAFFWLHFPLKRVQVDDNNLYISNYLKEITVPLGEIENVTDFILSEPRRVTIHFRNETEFGRKIVFLAKYRAFAFMDGHPIVDELIQMSVRKTLQ